MEKWANFGYEHCPRFLMIYFNLYFLINNFYVGNSLECEPNWIWPSATHSSPTGKKNIRVSCVNKMGSHVECGWCWCGFIFLCLDIHNFNFVRCIRLSVTPHIGVLRLHIVFVYAKVGYLFIKGQNVTDVDQLSKANFQAEIGRANHWMLANWNKQQQQHHHQQL